MLYLKKILLKEFSHNDSLAIMQSFQRVAVPKGTCLIEMHQRVRDFYFVESGLFRSFYVDQSGLDLTFDFYQESDVITILDSLMRHIGSDFGVEAIQDSVVWKISKDSLDHLMLLYPRLDAIRFEILAKHTEKGVYRTQLHQLPTAKERLARFQVSYPGVLLSSKHKDVASFLRLTKESFSRLIKQ